MNEETGDPRRSLRIGTNAITLLCALWLPTGVMASFAAVFNISNLWILTAFIVVTVLLPIIGLFAAGKCRRSRRARLVSLLICYLAAIGGVVLLAMMASYVGPRDLIRGSHRVATVFALGLLLGVGFIVRGIYHLTMSLPLDMSVDGPYGFEAVPMAKVVAPPPGRLPASETDYDHPHRTGR